MNDRMHKVLVTGLPYFARRIGSLVANDTWRVSVQTPQAFGNANRRRFEHGRLIASLPFYELMYQIGGPTIDRRVINLLSSLHRPIVLHWVGSDVCAAKAQSVATQQGTEDAIVHWADSPWLQAELGEIGIKSIIMPSSAVASIGSAPLPPGPLTVLLYVPTERFEFYRGPLMLRLAAELPNVNFLVVGDSGVGRYTGPNVRYLGWVKDMAAIYAQCHVLVRIPVHDGLSAMVVEALAHGRHVIWNYPMTGVLVAPTVEQVKAEIERLENEHTTHVLSLNQVGKGFVETNFSETKVAKEIRGGFQSALLEFHDRKVSKLRSRLVTL